jgi:hypothetical protein
MTMKIPAKSPRKHPKKNKLGKLKPVSAAPAQTDLTQGIEILDQAGRTLVKEWLGAGDETKS